MGRTARNYPKGRLKLRTPKEVQSNKRYPIYIEYNWQADSLRKTTEVSVFPKDWNENGYGHIGEIRATTDLDYKYYNAVLHKRLADTDAKIMQYYEKNGHVTGDVIRAFLDENYELLRPDSGKDFVEFAKELIKSKYDKGKIGVSSYKNHVSYLNKFSESHSHAARSFLKCFSFPSMRVVCATSGKGPKDIYGNFKMNTIVLHLKMEVLWRPQSQ